MKYKPALYKRDVLKRLLTKEQMDKVDDGYFHEQILSIVPELKTKKAREELLNNLYKKNGV